MTGVTLTSPTPSMTTSGCGGKDWLSVVVTCTVSVVVPFVESASTLVSYVSFADVCPVSEFLPEEVDSVLVTPSGVFSSV